ncbi:MAG: hypothetical protein D6744_00380, partial [Planctomycetota bacterium]
AFAGERDLRSALSTQTDAIDASRARRLRAAEYVRARHTWRHRLAELAAAVGLSPPAVAGDSR